MKWLLVMVFGLIGFVVGILNLFVLPESNLPLSVVGFGCSSVGVGIIGHHKIRENQRKAVIEHARQVEEWNNERAALENDLELWSGKDWAAQQTIDRIDQEFAKVDPLPVNMPPKEYGGKIAACAITADEVWNGIEIVNGDGDVVAEFPEPEDGITCGDCGDHHDDGMPCLSHALGVIHDFKRSLEKEAEIERAIKTDHLDEQMRKARENPW